MSNKLLRIALVIVAVYMLLNLGAFIVGGIVVSNATSASRTSAAKVQQETALIAPYRNTTIADAKTIADLSVRQVDEDKILNQFLITALTQPGEHLTPTLRRVLHTLKRFKLVQGKTLTDPLRHRRAHVGDESAFGTDRFGQLAERFARFFGTPKFIIGQTLIVVIWIVGNAYLLGTHPFDKYPFILLNLMFSTQAAYAAPLILLAQTRQAERDKATAEADAHHREEVAERQASLIEANTALTQEVHELTKAVHDHLGCGT